MRGERGNSGRKVPKAHDQKHRATQEASEKARRIVKYLNRKIVEELHQAIILETSNKIPECSHILNPSASGVGSRITQEMPVWAGSLP